jgi:hypothetical protein
MRSNLVSIVDRDAYLKTKFEGTFPNPKPGKQVPVKLTFFKTQTSTALKLGMIDEVPDPKKFVWPLATTS